jgi:hypothetical protein
MEKNQQRQDVENTVVHVLKCLGYTKMSIEVEKDHMERLTSYELVLLLNSLLLQNNCQTLSFDEVNNFLKSQKQ